MTGRERAVSASEREGNNGVPERNTEALLATVREALDGGVPLLYPEARRARRAAADAALDAIASELERVRAERDRVNLASQESARWAMAQSTRLNRAVEALRRAEHELDQWVFADGTAAYRVERAEKIIRAALTEIEESP